MRRIVFVLMSILMLLGCGTGDQKVYKEYKESGLNPNHIIQKLSYDEIMQVLEDKDAQIFYIGWPDCPNCQAAIKYIDNVAKNMGFKKIYYHNIKLIREEDQADYKNFIEKIGYENDNKMNSGVSRMAAPTVIVRKEGQTLNWVTKEFFVQEDTNELSEENRTELVAALTELYNLLKK